jgi:hypothetical protein
MEWVSLPLFYKGRFYFLSPISGALLVGKTPPPTPDFIPDKLRSALRGCDNPYSLSTDLPETSITLGSVDKSAGKIADRTRWCSKFSFVIAKYYASVTIPIFKTSRDAIFFFENHPSDVPQNVLCLSRTLFAAKTAKSFSKSGVILIGAFLPSRLMHAWIIEDGFQVDPNDRVWTQYRPVGAFL